MSKKNLIVIVFLMGLFSHSQAFGQDKSMGYAKTYKVAIVAPLYLDSIFSGDFYKYGKGFPAFAMAGFDFVQGASMAIQDFVSDSIDVEAKVFDSKASVVPLSNIISNGSLDDVKLIIGSVKDQDYMLLAKFAAAKKIPFVSATYPNDGGIKNDPFLIIQNSTLQSHCESIFTHLLTNYGTEKIVFVKRPGARGDMVSELFAKLNSPDKNQLLNLDIVNIEAEDYSEVAKHLDSTKSTTVIGASLNNEFCVGLVKYLASIKNKYPSKTIGMPSWEGINFNGAAYKDYEILYTANYYNPKTTTRAKAIAASYKEDYKGNASDYVYKAYDVTTYFLSILKQYPNDIMGHINDGTEKVFTNPIYFPDYTDANDAYPNFYENKRVFFLKKVNGVASRVW